MSSLFLTNVTFSNNSANYGGGLYIDGESAATLTNVTISNNSANNGGGIYLEGNFASLTNVTISGNSASNQGGGVYIYKGYNAFIIKNSLIGGNTGFGPDCYGRLNSAGYNLITDTWLCTIKDDQTGNIYGKFPLLGPLADNGGYTLTHALLPGSPAIDAASFTNSNGNPIIEDQRGVSRPQGTANDIGAYEADAPMHVQGVALRINGTRLFGLVKVYDQTGSPVANASVMGTLTGPVPPRSASLVTNMNGIASFNVLAKSGTWKLCVTNILKDGYTYDPSQNVKTCTTLKIP